MQAALLTGLLMMGVLNADIAPKTLAERQANLLQQLGSIAATGDEKGCPAVVDPLDQLIDEPDFATLPENAREIAYEFAAHCALDVKRPETAHSYALDATRSAHGNPALWRIRFAIELQDGRHAQAFESIEAMAVRNPEALNALPISWLFSLYRELRKLPDKTLSLRLAQRLSAPAYQPVEPLASGDAFKRETALALNDAGKRSEAAALIGQIADPDTLIGLSIDPHLRAYLPKDFDGRAAMEARLKTAREIAARQPGSLSAILETSRYLRRLGRPEEALAMLEAANPDGPHGKDFTDLDDRRNWWWDEVARSRLALGQYEAAIKAYRGAVDAGEQGGGNVSQTINLGHAHLSFGKPAAALATIAAFDKGGLAASPYGKMEMRLVRICAHAELGDIAATAADVAYAKEHEQDHREALTDMLLCVGDNEGAAASLIRRLDDADRRADTLLQLSDYDPHLPAYRPPPYAAKLMTLKARPDVAAAIARAGGTRRYHLIAEDM